jgi:ketosteroid isomerase-like protein
VIEDRVVADIARHWDEGWNGADVEVIMAPFAEDVLFASPFLPRLTGDPDQRTIDGAEALREYVVAALARASEVRYTLHQALAGTDTVVLVYTCHLPDGSDRPGGPTCFGWTPAARWSSGAATTPPTRPAGGPEPPSRGLTGGQVRVGV